MHVTLDRVASMDAFLVKLDAGTGVLIFAAPITNNAAARVSTLTVLEGGQLFMTLTSDMSPLRLGGSGTRGTTVEKDEIRFQTHGMEDIVLTRLVVNAPVDCIVSQWTPWTECTEMCDTGSQTRARVIVRPPSEDGLPCPPDLAQEQQCNTLPCLDCILPRQPAHVVAHCMAAGKTRPVVCDFLCDTGLLQLDPQPPRLGNVTMVCPRTTGEWSGVMPNCRLPAPGSATLRPTDPAVVRLTSPVGVFTHHLVYSVQRPGLGGGIQLPDCTSPAAVNDAHAAARGEATRALGVFADVTLHATADVVFKACGNPTEVGDDTTSHTVVVRVDVLAHAPSFVVRGIAPVLVAVYPQKPHAAADGQDHGTAQVVAASCDCYVPSVSCTWRTPSSTAACLCNVHCCCTRLSTTPKLIMLLCTTHPTNNAQMPCLQS